MLTFEDIIGYMKGRNLADVSRETGIPYAIVWRTIKGPTLNPSYNTVRALSRYLTDRGIPECPYCHDGANHER